MDHVSAKRVSEGTTRRIKFGSDVECGDDVGSSDEQLPHAEQTASESEPLFRRNFIDGGRHLTRYIWNFSVMIIAELAGEQPRIIRKSSLPQTKILLPIEISARGELSPT